MVNSTQSTLLQGEIDLYKAGTSRYPYFTSGDLTSTKAVVFLGGLTNGILDVGYLPKLSATLGEAGWKLVQMHWSSAYDGYATGSLDRDVREMSSLIYQLRERGATKIVIMGHSTGSQDVIHYLTSPIYADRAKVDGGIMQAPVSDREFMEINAKSPNSDGECQKFLDQLPLAQEMVERGDGEELLPTDVCEKIGMKITAYRLFSLYGVGGDDDYFSSDIPINPPKPDEPQHVHPLSLTFGKLPCPVLAAFSEKDEYSPGAKSWTIMDRWRRVSDSAGGDNEVGEGLLETMVVMGASHGISEVELQQGFCDDVVKWLEIFVE